MSVATRDHVNQGAVKPSVFRRALTDDGLRELNTVLDNASRLLSPERSWELNQIEDFTAANSALGEAWSAVTAALKGDAVVAEHVATGNDLVDLLSDIRKVDAIVRVADTERRRGALNTVRTALARFHDVDAVSELIDLVPEAICTLGFDRSFISRIHESMWVPESVHVIGDPDWTDEILRAGVEHPQRLGPQVFESEIVRVARGS